MDSVQSRIAQVQAQIDAASARAGRAPVEITLVAVSKARQAQEIRAAFQAGLGHFGENYLTEAIPKLDALADLPITWHFIGAIQSNKTREIAARFQWVHTIDRDKIARRLSDQRGDRDPLDVLIQVNLDAEPTKAGVLPHALAELVDQVVAYPRLRLRGLMAIPRPTDDAGQQRAAFERLHQLFDAHRAGNTWDTLSMGMSADFAPAIAAGATMVRIGTAIFGPRPTLVPRAGERM